MVDVGIGVVVSARAGNVWLQILNEVHHSALKF